MALHANSSVVTAGLVFNVDTANSKSYAGEKLTNLVPDAKNMTGWSPYSSGNDGTFATEFGTVGYRVTNRGSWNGLYRGISLPNTGTYTFSAWYRYLGGSSNNNGGTVYISGTGLGYDVAASVNKSLVGVWQRISYTVTCTNTSVTFYLISYGGTSGADNCSWEVTMPQIEARSYATPWVASSRTNTQVLRDTTGNHQITTTTVSTSNNGTIFSYNGANYSGFVPNAFVSSLNTIPRAWEVVVKPNTTLTTAGIFGHVYSGGCTYYCNGGLCIWSGQYAFNWYDNNSYQFLLSGVSATSGQYVHIIGTYSAIDNKPRIYINGNLAATFGSASNLNYGGNSNNFFIAFLSASGNTFIGNIDIMRYYYNREFTADDAKRNFAAIRNRFGL